METRKQKKITEKKQESQKDKATSEEQSTIDNIEEIEETVETSQETEQSIEIETVILHEKEQRIEPLQQTQESELDLKFKMILEAIKDIRKDNQEMK